MRWLLGGLAVVVLTGCSAEPLPPVSLPDGVTEVSLSASEVSPGEDFEVSVPAGSSTGAGWWLTTGDGEDVWSLSPAYGSNGPTSWDADDDRPVGALAFEGPTTLRFAVPDDAQDGEWLMCEWDGVLCTVLRVTE